VTGHPAGEVSRAPVRGGARLLLPAVVVTGAVAGTATVSVLMTAFGLLPLVGAPTPGAAAFVALGGDLLLGLRESLVIATLSTLLAAVVGLATALLLVRSDGVRRRLGGLTATVLSVPHLVGAATVGLLLSGGGLLPRWLGVAPTAWPELVGGSWPVAVVLELAWKESAFVALVVTASLSRRLTDLQEVAAVLGADARQRLLRVTVPLAAPALLASAGIAFLYAFGSYEVAWLLGRAYPEPLPVLAQRLFSSIDLAARPQAAAAALVGLTVALAVAALAVPVLRRWGVGR
jgi:putative spermidine/putrescine transport system permease protein